MRSTAPLVVAPTAVARSAVRPIDGELSGWNPVKLAAVIGSDLLRRAQLAPDQLDEVIVGCADPVGACGANAARAIALAAQWPPHIGGLVIDRGETSGLTALQVAAAAISCGQASAVMVFGLGLCSVVPPGAAALNRIYGAPWGGVAEHFAEVGGLLPAPRLAEKAAAAAGISRAALDAAAEQSRCRRAEANPSPAIVAVEARPQSLADRGVRRGDPVDCDVIRDWGSASDLPPAFDDDGLLTAASFAVPADQIAAVLLQAAPQSGTAGARIIGTGRAVGDPFDPVGNVSAAVNSALSTADSGISEIDQILVAEHDAATAMLVAASLHIDVERVNRHGGALATGNSGAAEELRLITDSLTNSGSGSVSGGVNCDGTGLLLAISAGPGGSAAVVFELSR